MSIEIWTQWVSEFQQYLAVFDEPTRHFLYAIAIGATILSLVFSYYMTKVSLQFASDLVKAIFEFLKNLGEMFVNSLKLIFSPRQSAAPENLHENSQSSEVEA